MNEFFELVGELARLGKDATVVALEKARSLLQGYFLFLKKTSVFFGIFLAFVAVVFFFGALFDSRPVKALAVFLGGMAAFLWGLAAFPIVWAVTKGLEWESLRKTFQLIGVATLWILFLSIYFYFIPVPLAAVPIVMVFLAGLAIASVVFGVGISTRFLALRLGTVFVILTVFFVLTALMPSSLSGFGKLIAWFDLKTGEGITEKIKPLPVSVSYQPEMAFFDPRTQKPVIWYYQKESGEYELFNAEGFHPRYGVELEPVTRENVRELEKFFRDKLEREEMAKAEEEKKKAEEKRLADLENLVKETKAELAEVSKKPILPGLAGKPGKSGPRGKQGERGEPGKVEVVVVHPPQPSPPQPLPPVPSEPPEPVYDTVPAGTRFSVRLNTEISTEKNQVGDEFSAEISEPVIVNRKTVFPRGTPVTGYITILERPGRASGTALVVLAIRTVSLNGTSISIRTEEMEVSGRTTKLKDAAKIGVSTGIGALIGGLLGGKEGAAKGAAVGAGAGTAAVLVTPGRDLVLPPELKLEFRLAQDLNIEVQ